MVVRLEDDLYSTGFTIGSREWKRPPAWNDLCTCTSRDCTPSRLLFHRYCSTVFALSLSIPTSSILKENSIWKDRGLRLVFEMNLHFREIYSFFYFHCFVVFCFLFFRFLVSFGEKVSCIVIYKANLKSLIAWWVIKVKLLSRFTMNFHWYSMSTIFEDLWRSYMYNPSRLLFYKKSRTILLFFFQTLYRDYSNLYYKNFHNYIFFKNACSSWLITYICLTKRIEHDG